MMSLSETWRIEEPSLLQCGEFSGSNIAAKYLKTLADHKDANAQRSWWTRRLSSGY